MRGTLIMSLAISLIAVIFALQNSGPISVNLGPFAARAPLALVLLLTLATGVLVGYLSTLSRALKMGSELRKLKKGLPTEQPVVAPQIVATPQPDDSLSERPVDTSTDS